MFSPANAQFVLGGEVFPGYESVRTLFESNLRRGSEVDCQLCAYVGGQRVVDLWGSFSEVSGGGGVEYGPDSLQCVFSSGKSLSSACAALLVDKGRLDYGERICTYWPEFGQRGKQDLRLEDVLRHEAGMVALARTVTWKDMFRKGTRVINSA